MNFNFTRVSVKETDFTKESVQIISATLLIAVLSQIVIPFKPVPFTGQTLGILFSAGLLGKKKGMAAVCTYILLGTVGMPFFAGGNFGLARLAGPTGGYLIGFVAATYVVGMMSDKGRFSSFRTAAIAMIAGNAVIYVFGVLWLSNFVGWTSVLNAGLYPFIPGDIIKILIAASLIPAGSKYIK
jgi:biotin transporter BioY